MRAVVSGGVSFSFAENYYLSEWVGMLKHSYKLPCRSTLTDNHLVQLYLEACRERNEALKEVSCCTHLWDGWTDVSNQFINTLMVLHQESSELLDVVNFSRDRHTAENMLTVAIDILKQSFLKDRIYRLNASRQTVQM